MKEHKISLTTAVLLSINILVGSGILIGPARITAIAGNAGFLAWPLVALLFLPLVLCMAQLSRMFPGCGGVYAYAKEGINKPAGFISGWLYVVGYTFAAGVDLLALRKTLAVTSCPSWLIDNAALFNGVALLFFGILNLLSFKFLSRLLNSLTIAKIIPLVTLILLLPFIFTSSFAVTTPEISLVPYSLPLAIFGFFGFEYCCSITHLIQDSERNAPRAIVIGFMATAAIYTLFHFGLLQLMGAENLVAYGAPAYAQFLTTPIPYLKALLMWLIPIVSILTIFAGINGMINANIIMLHAMSQEKLFSFWPLVARMNSNHRPTIALLLEVIAIFAIATFIADIDLVSGLCNVGVFLSFLLPFISLAILQQRKHLYKKFALTIVALITTIGLTIYSLYLLGESTYQRMLFSLPLLAIVIGGYILFMIEQRRHHSKA